MALGSLNQGLHFRFMGFQVAFGVGIMGFADQWLGRHLSAACFFGHAPKIGHQGKHLVIDFALVLLGDIELGKSLVVGMKCCFCDIAVAVFIIPSGNLMPPPQLARDAPILDVVHPLVISVNPIFGDEFHRAAVNRVFGFLRQAHAFEFAVGLTAIGRGAHGDKPLAGEHGLNHRACAVAFGRHQRVRFGVGQ